MPADSGLLRALAFVSDSYRLGVAALTTAVGTFLLLQLHAWPPHEDETLVLFVSRQPLGNVFDTVVGERGGAPLHFFLSHLMTAVWPGLTGLRLISAAFAVASVPVVAALVARLSDRRTALAATVIVAASWMTLFHGVYARMYSLFLFTSALSLLLLLRAVERRRTRPWAAWAVTTLAMLATQPYGSLVLLIEGVYVLGCRRRQRFSLRPAAVAFTLVTLLAVPLWLTYRVLVSRFDITLTGGRASKLGSPADVAVYLGEVVGDFTAGWLAALLVVGGVALVGLVFIARTRPGSALLAVSVFAVPALALIVARSRNSVFLESRHLIFALPFFAMLLAAGLMRFARVARGGRPLALKLGLLALASLQIAWGWHTTPALYAGENETRRSARDQASTWLAVTSRSDDILFGYEPLFLDAWASGARLGTLVVPRADPRLALDVLAETEKPLGRGVWVFDGTDQLDPSKQRLDLPLVTPGDQFEARVYGPFLILRTKEPVVTSAEFLRATMRVQLLGQSLEIGDSGINYQTAFVGLARLVYGE